MVDVLTVLIFFFLLTMQFKDVYAVDITPPTMKTSKSESVRAPNVLVVKKGGGYVLNEEPATLANLKTKFAEIAKSQNPSVIVYADSETPLKFVTDAVDMARLAKIRKLSLRANP